MRDRPTHSADISSCHYPNQHRILGIWQPTFYYGWIVLAVVFLAEFASSGMGGLTVALFFPSMGEDTGWSLTQLTGAVTAQGIAALVISPIIGPLLDRYGARPVMVAGAITAGTGMLLMMTIQSVWHYWVLYAIIGALGMGELGRLSGPIVVAKWFVRLRGRAMALATSGTTIGGVVMAPIIGILITAFGWRSTWGILGITVILMMVPTVALFMRRQPEDLGLNPDGDPDIQEPTRNSGPQPAGEVVWTLREAIRTRSLWVIVISMNLASLSAGGLVYHQVPYFTEQGMSLQGATMVFTISMIGGALSRIPWGFLIDRFPVRTCLASAFAIRSVGPLALLIIPFPYNIVPFVAFWAFLAGSFSLLQPMAFANYYGRTFMGSIFGTLRPLMSLSQLVGPLFIAILFDWTGTFDLALAIVSTLGFIGAAIALLAEPPIHSRNTETTRSGEMQIGCSKADLNR